MPARLLTATWLVALLAVAAWLLGIHDRAVGGSSLPGDANCNGTTNAIDAAIILQFDAGILQSVPCPQNADVASFGSINAVDAAVILQFDAGLISSLPSGPTATATRTNVPGPTNTPAPPTPTRTPGAPTPTRTATPDASTTPCMLEACPLMFFTVGGLGDRCTGMDVTDCDVFLNERFVLGVSLDAAPAGGYYGIQTLIVPDGMDYDPTGEPADEFVWPDAFGFTLRHTDLWIAHGAATAQLPPFPVSMYAGPLVQLDFGCGGTPSSHTLLLLALSPGTSTGTGIKVAVADDGPPSRPARGTDVVEIDGSLQIVADRLTVNCIAP